MPFLRSLLRAFRPKPLPQRRSCGPRRAVPRVELLEPRDLLAGSFAGPPLPVHDPSPGPSTTAAPWAARPSGEVTPAPSAQGLHAGGDGRAPEAAGGVAPSEHWEGREAFNRPGPNEWAYPGAWSADARPRPEGEPASFVVLVVEGEMTTHDVQNSPLPSAAAGDSLAGAANEPAADTEQPAPAQPAAAVAVERVTTNIPLPVTAEQGPSRQTAGRPLAPPTVAALSPPLNVPALGAQGAAPSASLVFGLGASEDVQTDHAFPLAPEVGPASGEGPADRPAPGPALAGLLTPAVAWVGPGPFRLLRQFFPGAADGGRDLAAALTRLLRFPWVAGAATALAALEVLRRRARRGPAATELPEITGPSGL